eukprot:880020-Pyramimonas_sp.AAC.1
MKIWSWGKARGPEPPTSWSCHSVDPHRSRPTAWDLLTFIIFSRSRRLKTSAGSIPSECCPSSYSWSEVPPGVQEPSPAGQLPAAAPRRGRR